MEIESHSVLLSSHITEDLEKIADYITLIEKGNVILSENKEELLENYGVASFSKEDIKEIEKKDYVSIKQYAFGCKVLVQNKKMFLRKYDGAVMDNASLEDIMVFYHER